MDQTEIPTPNIVNELFAAAEAMHPAHTSDPEFKRYTSMLGADCNMWYFDIFSVEDGKMMKYSVTVRKKEA